MKKVIIWVVCGTLFILLAIAFLHRWIPDTLIIQTGSELPVIGIVTYERPRNRDMRLNPGDLYIEEYCTAKLMGIIPIKTVRVCIFEDAGVLLGGMLFGVQFESDLVYVAGLVDSWNGGEVRNPAKSAGLRILDVVEEINGIKIYNTREAEDLINTMSGQDLTVKINRNGIEMEVVVTPEISRQSQYSYGIQFQDYVIGVGTLSYLSPVDNRFGGFGHGVKYYEDGELLSVKNSSVLAAHYNTIVKGTEGKVGELVVDYLGTVGSIAENGNTGVYGYLNTLPSIRLRDDPIPVGLRDDISEGEALMYSTVDADGVRAYKIEILDIYEKTQEHKDFLIKITDPDLIEKTGGIVQGMSGSPIVQNGKFVGALSHVILSDATKGYGILSYNMIIKSDE